MRKCDIMFEKLIYNMKHDIMFRMFVENYYEKRNEVQNGDCAVTDFKDYLTSMCGIYGSYVLSQIESSFLQEGEDIEKYGI